MPVIVLLRGSAEFSARPDVFSKCFGEDHPGGSGYLLGSLAADRFAVAQAPHGFFAYPGGFPHPCPLAFRQQFQKRSRSRIGGILTHSTL